jgi:hypothetical protein
VPAETPMLDLGPAASEVARLAGGVRDDHLGAPTPCEDMTVADLLAHIVGLTVAFRLAAEKAPPPEDLPQPGQPDELPADWRVRLPREAAKDLAPARAATAGLPGRSLIPTPGDQFGLIGLGHQWNSVCGLMVCASSRRQRSAMTASRSARVAKCRLTTGSSTKGQRCSAGCSSGL